jgi:hypothetical protein
MIILGLIIIACIYLVAFISKIFDLSVQTTSNLMIWTSTGVICSLLIYLGVH